MPNDKRPDASRRSEHSRQAILQAARELVAEVGYAKLTIEGIAARAGVGKQTIYRWWRSKGEVLLEAFLELSMSQEGMALPDTGDIEADLKQVMRATAAEFSDVRWETPIRVMNLEIASDPELAAQYREKLAGPVDEIKKERLRSAQRAGQIAEDADLDVALDIIWAPLYQRWILRTGPLTPEYTDAIVEHALKALRP